ncbi:MAG: hypothetical protein ACJ0FW_00655 [Gammaproteobacteria bacterium]
MKKFLLILIMFFSITTYSQSTSWIPIVIEEGKDMEYLAFEKNWMSINQALIDAGYRTGWSVWKRTPKDGDDGWAQYYVVVGNNDEKILSQDEWPSFMQKALGKSQRAISKMMDGSGIVSEGRTLQLSWVGGTVYAGESIKPGDKMYFHYMTKKNDDFENLELNVWKPIAEEQIVDGIRKFWGLAEVTSKSENFPGDATHVAFNIMNGDTFSQTQNSTAEFDFSTMQLMGLMQESREMLEAEELTCIYIIN